VGSPRQRSVSARSGVSRNDVYVEHRAIHDAICGATLPQRKTQWMPTWRRLPQLLVRHGGQPDADDRAEANVLICQKAGAHGLEPIAVRPEFSGKWPGTEHPAWCTTALDAA